MGNFDAAMELAARGFAVFPCEEAGQARKRPKPGVKWRDVSVAGRTHASALWSVHEQAVPGIDLAKAGLLVIDCDRKPGGPDGVVAFTALCDAVGYDLSPVPQVVTPSGGLHVYFRQRAGGKPGQKPLGNATGDLPPGIDVRGAGGYVIGPGARFTDDGGRYELVSDADLLDAPTLPDWLVQRLTAGRGPHASVVQTPVVTPSVSIANHKRIDAYLTAAFEREVEAVRCAPAGTRNQTLNDAALKLGHYVGAGLLDAAEVRQALLAAAMACGLVKEDGQRQCERTIASGLSKGLAEPRGIPDSASLDRPALAIGAASAALIGAPPTGEEIIRNQPERDGQDATNTADIDLPPGLVGDLAHWIADTARRPNRLLSLGAALTIVGTLAGRHFATPTRSGTHLYVLGLAVTGSGKDHPLQQTKRILRAIQCSQHIGPGEFISMPAVINFLLRAPLAVCPMDEFGGFLKRINARGASGFEGAISKVLRTLWGSSFQDFTTPEWAGRPFAIVMSPAISLLGASTHDEFYASLEAGAAEDGTLNRFLLLDCGRARPKDRQPPQDPSCVPPDLKRACDQLYYAHGALIAAQLGSPNLEHAPTCLAWGEGAEALFQAYQNELEEAGDQDAVRAAFTARSAEMAVRIATIVALGRGVRQVDEADMRFGITVASRSARAMMQGAADYMSDSEHQDNVNRIKRAIKAAGGVLRHRDLQRGAGKRMRARDLKDAIGTLVEGEEVVIQYVRAANNKDAAVYRWVG